MERSLGKGFHSVVSPSGRWLAYISVGVFVRPFPGGEGRWQIAASGFEPRWAPDEKHLYYRLDNVLWRVPIELGETVRVGKPVASTIEMAPNGTVTSAYDIGPDGTIWAAQTSAGEVTAHNRLHLITNWALP
jgi:hypothetical protein